MDKNHLYLHWISVRFQYFLVRIWYLIFLTESMVRRFLFCSWSFSLSGLHTAAFLLAGRLILCALMSLSFIKVFLHVRFRLVLPCCWKCPLSLLCLLIEVTVHLFFYPASSEHHPHSIFRTTSWLSWSLLSSLHMTSIFLLFSLIPCFFPPKFSRKGSFFKLSHWIKTSFPESHTYICFFSLSVICLVLYNLLNWFSTLFFHYIICTFLWTIFRWWFLWSQKTGEGGKRS